MPSNLPAESIAVRPANAARAIRARICQWPRQGAMGAVRLYQVLLSPLLLLLFGPTGGCRFHPTCSRYALDALRLHGLFGGLYLTARRLLRCHPFHAGGEDPVPATWRIGPEFRPAGRGARRGHLGTRLS